MVDDASERLIEYRERFESCLNSILPLDRSSNLYEAVAYVLESPGKRVRPLLVLTTAEAFGADIGNAMPAALAVEVFHAFTLVHDDIMDRSDSRRGLETVHVRWNDPIGILAGDYLLAMSFDLLTQLDRLIMARAIARFHEMVARLCEGQAIDTEFESRAEVSEEEYLDMISRKTGALLEASLFLGGLTAGASDEDLSLLELVGHHAGCAFQIQDDLLDLTAESTKWGKPVGGDLLVGKKSFLTVNALQHERSGGGSWWSERMKAGGMSVDEIVEAKHRLERMGVLVEAERQIGRHYRAALDALSALERSADVTELKALIESLLVRSA